MNAGIAMGSPTESSSMVLGERPMMAKFGGATIIVGVLLMIAGAITWGITGTDLDAALVDGTVGAYLTDAADHVQLLTANLSFWIVGVVFLSIGGLGLSRLSPRDSVAATAAQGIYIVGAALAIGSFAVWMGIVRELAPAHAAGADLAVIGAALGQAATIADWIGTEMFVSVGPVLLSISGRNTWVPRWLLMLGVAAAIAGAVTILGLYIGERTTLGFISLPVGFAWTIAAGIVALRYRTQDQ